MSRKILQFLIFTALAFAPLAAQTPAKIDVNLASATELQRLPGIHEAEARKIVAGRPYAKPADLRTAGLTDAQITPLESLITFGSRQHEIPSRQGGYVALIEHCKALGSAGNATEITSARVKGQTTVCLPREWFGLDGHTLTAVGETKISDLTWSLSKESVKDVSIVTFLPADATSTANTGASGRAWTDAATDLLLTKLNSQPGKYTVERVSGSSSPPNTGSFSNSLHGFGSKDSISTAYFDPTKVSDKLVLVMPTPPQQ
jgi:hypothetical protein